MLVGDLTSNELTQNQGHKNLNSRAEVSWARSNGRNRVCSAKGSPTVYLQNTVRSTMTRPVRPTLVIPVLLLLACGVWNPAQTGSPETQRQDQPLLWKPTATVLLGRSLAPLNGPWKFHVGDSPVDLATSKPLWAEPGFDDSSWETVDLSLHSGRRWRRSWLGQQRSQRLCGLRLVPNPHRDQGTDRRKTRSCRPVQLRRCISIVSEWAAAWWLRPIRRRPT